jgi:hypothetical protein
MTPLEQLKVMLPETYRTYKDEEYTIELMPGLGEDEIEELASQLPGKHIPDEIKELLSFSSGFLFFGLDAITFDGIGDFETPNLFHTPIRLAGDGYGNYFILDVNKDGVWGSVYYWFSDPQVLIKHSNSITEFLLDIYHFGKNDGLSSLDAIHNRILHEIWEGNSGFISRDEAVRNGDPDLAEFAYNLPWYYNIADLRDKPTGSGFAWGKFGTKMDKTIRHPYLPLWAFAGKPPMKRRPQPFGRGNNQNQRRHYR